MNGEATESEVSAVVRKIEDLGFQAHVSQGVERTVIGVVGHLGDRTRLERLGLLSGVQQLVPISRPYKLVSREFKHEDSVIYVDGVPIGGKEVVVIAGPCSVESQEQLLEAARGVKKAGAKIIRGGAFKPRTSPYSFQGLGEEALRLLQRAKSETGLPIDTEITSIKGIPLFAQKVDLIQIGTRNAQNFDLIQEVARLGKPILLKRGMSSTVQEWLLAAEYILQEGNPNVVLCERGTRTFETMTRNTLDLSAVAIAKRESHLPVVVDPSHGTGDRTLVAPMARAALAAGADGLIIEVHPHPEEALCDGNQSLTLGEFGELMAELRAVAKAIGRSV